MSPTQTQSGQETVARFALAQDILATLIGYAAARSEDPTWSQRMDEWMQRAQKLSADDTAAIDRILGEDGAVLRKLAQHP